MAELKRKKRAGDGAAFLHSAEYAAKRADAFAIMKRIHDIIGMAPVMWGDSTA